MWIRNSAAVLVGLILCFLTVLASADGILNPGGSASSSGTMTSATIVAGTNVTLSGVCTSTTVLNCTVNSTGGTGTPGGTAGQIQFNSAGSLGGFTMSGDCTTNTATGVITCSAIGGKNVTLSAAFTTTGGATTLAFGAGANTYTFPNASDTVATIAATQTLTNKSIDGSEINSGTVALARLTQVFGFAGYNAGHSIFYSNPLVGNTVTSSVGVANNIYCDPFMIYAPVTIKALGARIVATSTGNSNGALAGAIYNNLQRTDGVNRPGTLIDNTANFVTNAAASVAAAMANTTDAIASPGMYWTCVQTFDATVTYGAANTAGNSLIGASMGSATLVSLLGTTQLSAVRYQGASAFNTVGATGWANFDSSTTWTEITGTVVGPYMAIQVN